MGFVSCIGKFIICCMIVSAIITYIPGIPPDVHFSAYEVDPALPLEGPLAKNTILDHAERLYEGHLQGPESVASKSDDEIFTSTHGGDIMRIWGKNWENSQVITKIGPGCDNDYDEHICGKPLGIRFDKQNKYLYVADSYLGIFTVDVKTGIKKRLIDPSVEIGGHKPLITDDLDIDSAGNIYWSDASYNSNLQDGLIAIATDGSGRLIKYDAKTKTNTVIVPDLLFANGVQLSPDESFVLVCETMRHKVLRHWLKGPKKGKTEVFVSNLPGVPDNVRARKNGGYYVSLVSLRSPDEVDLLGALAPFPSVRRFLTRLQYIVKYAVDAIHKIYPNNFCGNLSYNIFNLGPIARKSSSAGTIIVEVDENGKITGSMHGQAISHISQTDQVGNNLFFGSPYNNYLGRLKLDGKPQSAPKKTTPSPKKKKDEL